MYMNSLMGLAQDGQRMQQPGGVVPPNQQQWNRPAPQQTQQWGGMQGYNGPQIGSQQWQDARAQGQHPLMDYFRQNRPQWQGGQSQMRMNMQPWNQPQQSSYSGLQGFFGAFR